MATLRRSAERPAIVRHLPLFLVTFFFVYATAFTVLPASLPTARVLGGIGIVLLGLSVLLRPHRITIDPGIAVVLLLYGAYCGWVALRTSMTGGQDMSLLISAALFFIQVFPGAMLIAVWLVRRDYTFDDVVLLLHAVIVVQACFIVLTFLSWDFRLFTLDLLHEAESNVDALHPFRVRGLTHNTGAKLSAFQGAGLFLTVYLFLGRRGLPRLMYLTLSVPLLLLSILLTGRVGLLTILLAAGMALLCGLRPRGISRRLVVGVVLASLAAVLGAFSFEKLYLAMGGREMAWGEDVLARVFRWVTDEFSSYFAEGTLITGTVGVLIREHWFLPTSASVLVAGDPTTWGMARIASDVGVIRMLFGTGLIGVTLLYGGALAMFLVTVRYLRTSAAKWLVVVLFSWLLVVELKEPYVVDLRYASLVALIMFYAVQSGGERTSAEVKA